MRRHFAPRAAGTSEHQVAAWVVEDLQTEVAELRGRGVAFEEYDSPELRTVDGVATTPAGKGAWSKSAKAMWPCACSRREEQSHGREDGLHGAEAFDPRMTPTSHGCNTVATTALLP
jgi:hypothetical protein